MSNFNLQIKNRVTREIRVISIQDFKKQFAKELKSIIENYSKNMREHNYLPEIIRKIDYEGDFYLSLYFNFNNYGRSITDWYIERIF